MADLFKYRVGSCAKHDPSHSQKGISYLNSNKRPTSTYFAKGAKQNINDFEKCI